MKIAVAQHHPKSGNIEENTQKHISLIEKAAQENVDALFFNELSLTGYEPKLAQTLKVSYLDPCFSIFQTLSDLYQITLGIGMPLSSVKKPLIGMVLMSPQKERDFYAKQELHESETPYFDAGTKQKILEVKGIKIGMGICFETLQPKHLKNCLSHAIDFYVVSTAKREAGMKAAIDYYREASKKNRIPILMANSIDTNSVFQCYGKSSLWNSKGELLAQLPTDKEGLICFDTTSGKFEVFCL